MRGRRARPEKEQDEMWMFGGKPTHDATASRSDASKGDVVVLISIVIVPAAMEAAFLAWWRLSKPFIAAQPGFISARLHRSLDSREGYRYVNVLEWRGDDAYRETLSNLWSSGPPPAPGIDWRPQLFELVETVG